MNNFAQLKPESPFYPVFPGGMVPIQNIWLPERGIMGGAGEHDFYRADVSKLSAGQLARIADMVAAQCQGGHGSFL